MPSRDELAAQVLLQAVRREATTLDESDWAGFSTAAEQISEILTDLGQGRVSPAVLACLSEAETLLATLIDTLRVRLEQHAQQLQRLALQQQRVLSAQFVDSHG